jgi:hypothetical protein
MRGAIGFLLLSFLAGCIGSWPFARQTPAMTGGVAPSTAPPQAVVCALVGKPAPEIHGEDLDGVPFQLSEYRGKVVVLDFWGHW